MPSEKQRAAAYNTKLDPAEEIDYRKWIAWQSILAGRDLSRDQTDYDVRGLYRSMGQSGKNLERGHGPDTFKKPNHPTFSAESIYSTPETPGGAWFADNTFMPSAAMAKDKARMAWLSRYMKQYEPGTKLDLSLGKPRKAR